MSKIVALTGGTGFIGNTTLHHLLLAGHHVRLLARNINKVEATSDRLQLIQGDLQQPECVQRLVENVDIIVHCAGRVRGLTEAQFIADNVAATRALVDAACQHSQLQHFIHISSLAARHPQLSYYAKSKYMSEEVLKRHSFRAWTILRPPAVYGPNDRELRPLFDWMRHGILWIPGNRKNRFSLLHCEDLGRLIVQLVSQSQPSEHILEPDDGASMGYQWSDIQTIAADVFHRRVRSITLPVNILKSVALLNMLFSSLINRAPMLTLGKVKELSYSNWISDPAKMYVDWQPSIDLRVGLKKLYSVDN